MVDMSIAHATLAAILLSAILQSSYHMATRECYLWSDILPVEFTTPAAQRGANTIDSLNTLYPSSIKIDRG